MMSAPPKRSAWPPRYFVVLWTTRSTPRPKGFCNAGDAKVLSHTLTASWAFEITASSRKSATFMRGFVGDSIHSIFVSGRKASSTSTRSRRSTKVDSTPYPLMIRVKIR